uniref:Uncharacterized protein n=1 Tax=Anguilla anguilla TaxID=7936 RepID=A0A0E9TM53_ANGAN
MNRLKRESRSGMYGKGRTRRDTSSSLDLTFLITSST